MRNESNHLLSANPEIISYDKNLYSSNLFVLVNFQQFAFRSDLIFYNLQLVRSVHADQLLRCNLGESNFL